jgi:large subunit ribosomal protein L23
MILIEPIKTEKAIGKIEFSNTITFKVVETATKKQVQDEVEKVFKVKVKSVKTYVLPGKGKRAIVRIADGHKAEDISSKLKMA